MAARSKRWMGQRSVRGVGGGGGVIFITFVPGLHGIKSKLRVRGSEVSDAGTDKRGSGG